MSAFCVVTDMLPASSLLNIHILFCLQESTLEKRIISFHNSVCTSCKESLGSAGSVKLKYSVVKINTSYHCAYVTMLYAYEAQ